MAITLKGANGIYEGTSGDNKPIDVPINTEFHELDTDKMYYFDGTNWNEEPSSEGGGFTPTSAQLAAMNSGITEEDVTQIGVNENNILSIQNVVGENSLTYVQNSYIATGDVGTTISLTPTQNSSWCHILITDPPIGMAYKITGTGGQNPRTWSFVDEELKIIGSAAENETVTDYILEVPFGTKYVIINARYVNPYSAKTADISERVTAVTADIQSEFGAVCVLRKLKSTSDTYTYTMKKSDFRVSPSLGNCGTYLISIVTWSTAPTYSMYAVSYSGGGTVDYTVVQKIAGADATVTCTNGVISITSSGKVQIYALR